MKKKKTAGKTAKKKVKSNTIVKHEPEKLSLTTHDQEIVSNIVLNGDISKLNPPDKVKYYNLFCKSLGLNPVTQPFQIIEFRAGQQKLYATKDCTEQLRKKNGVSITESKQEIVNDTLIVKVTGQDKTGRTDCSTGALNIKGLVGDALANAIMKAETKAKRRLTLSICGLGAIDATELETIPNIAAIHKIKNGEIVKNGNHTEKEKSEIDKKLNEACKALGWKLNQINEFIEGMIGKDKNSNNITHDEKEKLAQLLNSEIDKGNQEESK